MARPVEEDEDPFEADKNRSRDAVYSTAPELTRLRRNGFESLHAGSIQKSSKRAQVGLALS